MATNITDRDLTELRVGVLCGGDSPERVPGRWHRARRPPRH